MNRHADFLPGEAGFLLGLLQEVGGLKEFSVQLFLELFILCVSGSFMWRNLNVSAHVLYALTCDPDSML